MFYHITCINNLKKSKVNPEYSGDSGNEPCHLQAVLVGVIMVNAHNTPKFIWG